MSSKRENDRRVTVKYTGKGHEDKKRKWREEYKLKKIKQKQND
jgi:hypothetical protein